MYNVAFNQLKYENSGQKGKLCSPMTKEQFSHWKYYLCLENLILGDSLPILFKLAGMKDYCTYVFGWIKRLF